MAGPNIYDQIINGSFDAIGMQPQQLPRRSGGGFLELLTDAEGLDALPRNSQGYNPFLEQTPGAFGNNPMAQNTGGQPIPKAPHWVNSLTGLVEGTVNGFMAPANALAGKYDQMVIDPETGKVLSMMDPRLMDDAAAMAGLVTTGGVAMPKLPNTLGMGGAGTLDDLLSKARTRIAAREEAVGQILGTGKSSVPFEGKNGLALAGPDMSVPGGYRLTYFDKSGIPNGHSEFKNMKDAVKRALEDGYTAKSGTVAKTADGVESNPAFADWFGGSKVVDQTGKPMVLYHGTNAQFTEFSPSKNGVFGPGVYLTRFDGDALSYGKNLMPVYANIKNPLRMRAADFRRLRSEGVDIDQWQKQQISAGYDGVISPDMEVVVAFKPTQIKSVNNRGTFDPNDPNILRAGGVPIPYGANDERE
jgi:hypothetical protein